MKTRRCERAAERRDDRVVRPNALNDPDAIERARLALGKGLGINRVAKLVGLSNGTVQRIKEETASA